MANTKKPRAPRKPRVPTKPKPASPELIKTLKGRELELVTASAIRLQDCMKARQEVQERAEVAEAHFQTVLELTTGLTQVIGVSFNPTTGEVWTGASPTPGEE